MNLFKRGVFGSLIAFILFVGILYPQNPYWSAGQKPTKNETLDINEIPIKQPTALERAIDPEKYILGPGDVFVVNILSTDNINFTVTVGPTGDVLIPAVGIMNLNGEKLSDATTKMINSVQKSFPNAKIFISLMNIREFKIQIIGPVGKPGYYTITPVTRLNEIIDQANGFRNFAEEFNIRIERSDGSIKKINYLKYMMDGDLTNNPTFIEGDKIVVPFGDLDKEGIIIRGAIDSIGYDIIEEGESLANFLFRRINFRPESDLQSIIITRKDNRKNTFLTVYPENFSKTILKPGDSIDILRERGVNVNGFVQKPGLFNFFPGYSYLDYINMAGGNTIEGDVDRTIIRHMDGQVESVKNATIKRGDVIIVPRNRKNIIFGDLSILQLLVSVSTLFLTYYAAVHY